MNVIFTCGGTGGHINPAIALANTLKARDPNCNILFVGCVGEMEEQLVPKAGYDIKCLPGSRFFRQLNLKNIKRNVQGVGRILAALNGARKIIKDFKPDVIVGTGGYASFPALFVGSKMGIPTCVHEANAVPGLATRLAAGSADRILVNFAESGKAYKQQEKVNCVGMPVRSEFLYTKRADARKELGLDERPLIVSAFGSLGAKAMNEAMAEFMKLESDNGLPFQHIHATGSHGWKWMPDLVKSKGVDLESQSSSNCPATSAVEGVLPMLTKRAAASRSSSSPESRFRIFTPDSRFSPGSSTTALFHLNSMLGSFIRGSW